MQLACVEFARNVLNYSDATSTEFDKDTKYPVISLMEEQKGLKDLGGTMRLGSYPCILKDDSFVAKVYGKVNISERHRHRYEFNNLYKEDFQKAGMDIVGLSPDGNYVMISTIKKPFSYIVPLSRFPMTAQVFDLQGNLVKTVNDVPLNEITILQQGEISIE